MKQLTTIIFLVIIACSCNMGKTNFKSDLEFANLKGNIWKIDKTVYDTEAKSVCAAGDSLRRRSTSGFYAISMELKCVGSGQ